MAVLNVAPRLRLLQSDLHQSGRFKSPQFHEKINSLMAINQNRSIRFEFVQYFHFID